MFRSNTPEVFLLGALGTGYQRRIPNPLILKQQ